jgi:hypothetical protein
MDLDLLDETYPMGKSNLTFKDFGKGVLTGVEGGLTGLAQTCHFWLPTYAPLFFSKACILKTILRSMKHFPLAILS